MKKRYTIVSSAYDSKDRLIASKVNDYQKTHPLQKHFAKLAGEPFKETLHSEIATLIACKDTMVHKIIVVRLDSLGRMKMAKPCNTCMQAIKAYGVKEVYYSTDTEGVIKL